MLANGPFRLPLVLQIGVGGAKNRQRGEIGHNAAQVAGVKIPGALGRKPRFMRRLEPHKHRERLARRLFQKIHDIVRCHVVHPALGRRHLAIDFKGAIEIFALINEGVIDFKTWSRAGLLAVVKFSEVSRLITGFAHQRGPGDVGRWEKSVVVDDAVLVIVLAGENGGAARRTQRKRDERIAKAHALRRDAVHAR